jgi:hypothetical protein
MLKEIINTINSSNKSRETTENILLRIEDYFNLFDINEIKNDE